MPQSAALKFIKRLSFRVAPGVMTELQETWKVYRHRAATPDAENARLAECLKTERGLCVRGGLFEGMAYVGEAVGSAYLPKLIGSYEAELHEILERDVFSTPYSVVADIGCAEGYYAVGLAMRLPHAQVYAYDIDGFARRLCKRMAQANGLERRVTVRGECTPEGLQKILTGRSLVVCDCEGYESVLLDPHRVPALQSSDVLVELHDFLVPNVTETIRARFEPTHRIALIQSELRAPEDYPLVATWQAEERRKALDEARPQTMYWAWMQAR